MEHAFAATIGGRAANKQFSAAFKWQFAKWRI